MTDTTKPEVEPVDGPAPAELTISDVTVGEGPEAQPGDTVDVHYLGVDYETGGSSTRPGAAASPCASPSAASSPGGSRASPA